MRQTRCLLGLQLPGDLTESGESASMLTQLLVGYWPEASVPHYMGFLQGYQVSSHHGTWLLPEWVIQEKTRQNQ